MQEVFVSLTKIDNTAVIIGGDFMVPIDYF
jgi:hypothetical protein